MNESPRQTITPSPSVGGLEDVSTDTLQRLAARMQGSDAAEAPEFAQAIASVLASRLEGTPVPEETLEAIRQAEWVGIDPEPAP